MQLDTAKSEFLAWRRLIWPDDKLEKLLGPVSAILGVFTELANVLLRFWPPHRVLFGTGIGLIAAVPCYWRARIVLRDSNDLRTQEAKIGAVADCAWCRVFRICLFTFFAVLILQIITDPRELLAKSGAQWTVDAFFDAIHRGDVKNVKLFLAGRMTTDVPDSRGRPLPVILALNTSNAPVMLDLLVASGLDMNHSYEVSGALHPQRMTLLSRAIEKGSPSLVAALIQHHVDVNSPIQTFGAMGLTRDTNPLAAAIYWKRLEIAQMLLDAGADPAAGDYAAYVEARELREKSTGDPELSERLDAVMVRLMPHGAASARIDSELRLQGIEQKLNQVALASLRTAPGSPERRKLDAEYDQLQIERTKLRNALNPAAR